MKLTKRSGFTLLELSISTVILAVVGYSLTTAVKLGNDSNSTVTQVANESRGQRKSITQLIDDLRMTTNTRITITTASDGNSQVQLQMPIEVAGALVWGVRDRRLGDSEDTWNQADWTVRYVVDDEDQLVRRVVDLNGATRLEDVLDDDLLEGVGTPGFRMVQAGEVWQVNLATQRGDQGTVSRNEFHVRTRN